MCLLSYCGESSKGALWEIVCFALPVHQKSCVCCASRVLLRWGGRSAAAAAAIAIIVSQDIRTIHLQILWTIITGLGSIFVCGLCVLPETKRRKGKGVRWGGLWCKDWRASPPPPPPPRATTRTRPPALLPQKHLLTRYVASTPICCDFSSLPMASVDSGFEGRSLVDPLHLEDVLLYVASGSQIVSSSPFPLGISCSSKL